MPPLQAVETPTPPFPPDGPTPEELRGYGVMTLPFDTGHVLALRVFPETNHGSVSAVWHRTPEGAWSTYVDASSPRRPPPRLFESVCRESNSTSISVTWPTVNRVEIGMTEPALRWSVQLRRSPFTRMVNRTLHRIPMEAYRCRPGLVTVRYMADRALGFGTTDPGGTVSSGPHMLAKPDRLLLVHDARAQLGGVDLGKPTGAGTSSTAGSFRWPARGVVVWGGILVTESVA
jgi:hypothetical protein